jgi:S1-C subfamily serine protease
MSVTVRRKALTLSLALTALVAFPSVALAQSSSAAPAGPSQIDRAVTLASPGVVFVDTSVKIHVRLIFQNSNAVSGLGHLDRTYSFDYATGSGFVVTPSGVVVTASHVVEPEEQSMRNYAANKIVLEGYGYDYPDASSSPFDQYTLPLGYQNQLLQQCYHAVACDFTITPIETVYSAVDVAQGQLPKGTPARILTSTGFANTDVAVLQVNGTNMPTVSLGTTASDLQTGDDVTALGFPGTSRDSLQTGVTQPNKVFGKVSNIRPQGTSNLIEVDANIEPGMSGGPVIDQAGDVIGLISFSTVQSSGESGAKYLRTIDDINAALASAGVTAARGPVDDAFSKAMDLYWGSHFTAAVPALQRVLDVSAGHPLATQYLADAQAKVGTAADIPVAVAASSSSGGGSSTLLIVGIVAVVVIVGGGLIMMSRKKSSGPAVAAPGSGATITAVGTPVSSDTGRSVGFQSPPAATSPTVVSPPSEATLPPPSVVVPPPPTAAPSVSTEPAPVSPSSSAAEHHFCASCGHELKADARFCPSCGHPVEE